MKRATLTITFESDWHIGSGAGIPGSVDRQVLRDENGLPYVSAKTLTGILRDAAEFVAAHRGNGYPDLVKSLFGHQAKQHGGADDEVAQAAILGIRAARFSRTLTQKLKKDRHLRDALFIVQPGVKIDCDTGRAKDDHLFFIEEVRADCSLQAQVTLNEKLPDEERKLLAPLLDGQPFFEVARQFLDNVALAVRRIGGKRRRGAGACKVELAWIDDCATEEEATARAVDAGGWLCVPLQLTTIDPIIVGRTVFGNVVTSSDHIPGTMLLPYVYGKLEKAVGDVALRKAVTAGNVVVSPFTPVCNGAKTSPVPLCLFAPKHEDKKPGEQKVYNRLVQALPKEEQCHGVRAGWVANSEEGTAYFDGKDMKTQQTHNSIEDTVQRPTENVGGVYTYEALRAGLVFEGEILINCAATKGPWTTPELWHALNGQTSIGVSRKDDYGRVELKARDAKDFPAKPVSVQDNTVVVWLLSDTLVRDTNLAYTANPRDLGVALQKMAKGTWTLISQEDGKLPTVARSRRVESWHIPWSRPRPSLVALQAGTVLTFHVEGVDEGALARLQREGLGDRRAEGYGRVEFNPLWLRAGDLTWKKVATEIVPAPDETQALPGDAKFLTLLNREAWKARIRTEVRNHVYARKEFFGTDLSKWQDIKAAQFGALRELVTVVPDELANDGSYQQIRPLLDWLGNSDGDERQKKRARNRVDKWDNKINATARLRKLFTDTEEVWRLLFPDKQVDNETKKALSGFALRTFVDTVCERRFEKEQQEEQAGHGQRKEH